MTDERIIRPLEGGQGPVLCGGSRHRLVAAGFRGRDQPGLRVRPGAEEFRRSRYGGQACQAHPSVVLKAKDECDAELRTTLRGTKVEEARKALSKLQTEL